MHLLNTNKNINNKTFAKLKLKLEYVINQNLIINIFFEIQSRTKPILSLKQG